MSLKTDDFGFWRALGSLRLGQVLGSWDFIAAVVLAAGGALLLAFHAPDPELHRALAADLLVVAAALFGTILAGFAIVAALLGDRYSKILEASGRSSLALLRHFVVVAGILVGAIVAILAFRAGGAALHSWSPGVEQAAIGVTCFLFLWGLFSSLELVKLILGVAVTNTTLRAVDVEDGQNRRASNDT